MEASKTMTQGLSPPLNQLSIDKHGYPTPPSTMSSGSRLSVPDFRITSPDVSPFDSISQRGEDHSDGTKLEDTPTSKTSDSGRSSGSSLLDRLLTSKFPVNGLSFVKRVDRIGNLPHYRLSLKYATHDDTSWKETDRLSADRKLEEEEFQASFVSLPDDMNRAQGGAREVPEGAVSDEDSRGTRGSGANTDGASDSGQGSGGSSVTDSQRPPVNGGSTTSGDSGGGITDGIEEIHHPPHGTPSPPGREVEPGDDEYPPNPPSSPENYRNRFFEIRKSLLAGYGAFASQDLKWGQKILVEPELFHADHVTLYDEFDKLTDGSRQAFKRMTAHCPYSGFDKITSIFRTNSFNVGGGQAGIFLVAARFNHACNPRNNVSYRFDNDHKRIIFTMSQDVVAGTELTITYASSREELYAQWGFICKCGGCVPLSDEEAARIVRTNWN